MKLRKIRRSRPRLQQRTITARYWANPTGSKVWVLMSLEYELPDGRKGTQVLHPLGHKDPYAIGHTCFMWGSALIRPDEVGDNFGGGSWLHC